MPARLTMSVHGPGCVKTPMFRLAGRNQVPSKAILCSDRFHQFSNSQDAHYPFHVVGQDV